MLVSDLITEDDGMPLLGKVILGRLKAGDSVRLGVHRPSSEENWEGPLQNVRLGSPMKMGASGKFTLIPRLFIHWRQRDEGTVGHSKSEWVRADTFDDRFELVKDTTGEAAWVLQLRRKQVGENLVDHGDPILVDIIEKRLAADETVNMDLTLPADQSQKRHSGRVFGIAVLRMKSAALRNLINADYGVVITYEKAGSNGYMEVVLSADTFDDLYTLEKSHPMTVHFGDKVTVSGGDAHVWTLTNV